MPEEKKQRLKEYQKIFCKAKRLTEKMFDFFSLHGIKMKEKILIFGEEGIIKNKFHIYEKSVSIDKVVIKRIILSKKIHMVIKVYINILLDIYRKVQLFHHHYAKKIHK